MKLTVDRDPFADAVTTTAKSIPARPSVPILAGIKLTAADGTLTVEGFDYEIANHTTIDAAVDSTGITLVSARLLAEIVKALPNKPIQLATTGAHLELVCGAARFTLPTMPAEDYPQLPAMPADAGTVDTAAFAAAVAQVAVAAGRDNTLPMMTGIRMETTGPQILLVATDRYRLAARTLDWTPEHADTNITALIPAVTLHDTAKAFGPTGGQITIAHSSNNGYGEGLIGLASGQRHTTSRLLDGGNYPPVMSLFPATHNAEAVVEVGALAEVVKRVALVADRTTPVLLTFNPDGELIVEAGGTEEARAHETMPATYTGEPLTVGFNPQYLVDGLQACRTAKVVMRFVDAFKPAVIHPCDDNGDISQEYRYLLMPIRVTR